VARVVSDAFAHLDRAKLPRHIAVIMDGNGRWAGARGLARTKGHAQGVDTVRMIIRSCRELGIGYVTLYAFSLENWNRPAAEIDALMMLLRGVLETEVEKLRKNDVRLNVIGRTDKLPVGVRQGLVKAMQATSECRSLVATIAISYSGRDEIARAAAKLAREAVAGEIDPETIDEVAFGAALDTADLPDPDLLIRTSGEMRLSNYLLWQLAYAEIYVTPTLWPDFDEPALAAALAEYAARQRRFGKTGAQMAGKETDR
jgi:undecaprenyl diphosphate synthase